MNDKNRVTDFTVTVSRNQKYKFYDLPMKKNKLGKYILPDEEINKCKLKVRDIILKDLTVRMLTLDELVFLDKIE